MLMSLFGTTELQDNVDVSHWIIYIWTATLSTVVATLYTSVMSQILLLNTVKIEKFAKAYEEGAADQRHADVAEQMTISRSPFARY
jgi:Na+-transporting NADH:ubiquinone oxidoreductase subunit NqrB